MTFLFKKPWRIVDEEETDNLTNELKRELNPRHPLYRLEAIPIARRVDTDDVLFEVSESENTIAEVHLTWKGSSEISPDWPSTIFYKNLEEWNDKLKKK